MPPKDDAAGIVLQFIQQQNRPVNVQNVTDALQKYGIKKAAIQKALDILAAPAATAAEGDGEAEGHASSGLDTPVIYKDYGKQRIYMARQDNLNVMTTEQMEASKQRISNLEAEAKLLLQDCASLERERGSLESALTLPQLQERIQHLTRENAEMEKKLEVLRGAGGGISTEERQKVDEQFSRFIGLWRKRKRMFKELWGTVTENFPRSLKEFQEELGIETDEDAGCSLAEYEKHEAPQGTGAKRKSLLLSPQVGKTIQTKRVVGPKEGQAPAAGRTASVAAKPALGAGKAAPGAAKGAAKAEKAPKKAKK